jgi:TolB-like protein
LEFSITSDGQVSMRQRIIQRGLVCVAVFIAMASPARSQQTLAVLDFDNNSIFDRERFEPLRKGLAQMFTSELAKVSALRLVERADLQKVVEEMKLGQAGMVDAATAQQVGRLVGAQNLVLGGFVALGGGKMRIDVRIVAVETGRTVKAEEKTGEENQLFEMVAALNRKLIRDLADKISSEDDAALGELRNVKFSAMLLFSQGVAAEDRGDFMTAREKYRLAVKEDAGFAAAKARLAAVEKSKN